MRTTSVHYVITLYKTLFSSLKSPKEIEVFKELSFCQQKGEIKLSLIYVLPIGKTWQDNIMKAWDIS